MNENTQVSREDYAKRKLSTRIAELETQVADLEFSVLFLQEENGRLKEQLKETKKEEVQE